MTLRLKTQRLGFDPISIHVRFFLVEERALGQFFSEYFGFPLSIIPPVSHNHLRLHLASMTNGRSRGTFQKSNALPEIGDHWMENYCLIKIWKGEGLFYLRC